MEYGININFFARTVGMQQAAELISSAGFTQLDYTPPLLDENRQKRLMEDLKIFAAYGLTVHQTHAPFNRYGRYGALHRACVERCAEITEQAGARFMVVHGDEFDFANSAFSSSEALAYNHDLFLPYVERAEKNGYKIAFETVFEDLNVRRYTSRADELLALITSFDSESAVCCWDFGHAHVAFKHDAPAVIRRFGKLIQCTHLHDNAGNDSHQLPMTGDIRWQDTMAAFRDIGYDGVMSVEYAHGNMPAALIKNFIHLTYDAVDHLCRM